MSSSSPSPEGQKNDEKQTYLERERVRELLRYFQPSSMVESSPSSKARLAKDTSLTAYAQLAALKLDCERSFIFIIDHERQYIIAEATRTISLGSEDIYDDSDDAIYLGTTSLDLVQGICPNTIQYFTSRNGTLQQDSEYIKASNSYYIVSDLSKAPSYGERPFVAGWPYMRYCAEVPLHSPAGLTLGSVCVVDNKPRQGIDEKGLRALEEIAGAVMNHLQLVTQNQQREHAERMIKGLGLFVEGKESLEEWQTRGRPISREANSLASVSSRPNSSGMESSFSPGKHEASIRNLEESQAENAEPPLAKGMPPSPSPETGGFSSNRKSSITPQYTAISSMLGRDKLRRNPNSNRAESIRSQSSDWVSPTITDLEKTLTRASSLVIEALGLDGAMFLRSSHASHASSVDTGIMSESPLTGDSATSTGPSIGSELPGLSGGTKFTYSRRKSKHLCKVLALSTREQPNFLGAESLTDQVSVSETVIQKILTAHPCGRIISIDSTWTLPHDVAIPQPVVSSGWKPAGTSAPVLTEEQELRELLPSVPGICSIICLPLWSANQDECTIYCLAWTTDPVRILQPEELVYLTSFGNSVMAELSRLETLEADHAKGTFISSVSHELRSPLHGVMASAEMLRDMSLKPSQAEIVRMIEVCGSTLLDTMNNILTFAKINNFTEVQGKITSLKGIEEDGLKSLISDVDLGLLVEEVMESCLAGYDFQDSSEKFFSPNIAITGMSKPRSARLGNVRVICDIEDDRHCGWVFRTQAGIWKRILLNLLGNSLKYTHAGHVRVQLRSHKAVAGSDENIRKAFITLSVSDSGKGMSREYQKHKMFKPFSQEDILCAGTGLGLSIVQQLVNSLGGSIEIKSEQGIGTKVVVSAVLESLAPENAIFEEGSPTSLRARTNGLKIGLIGFDVSTDNDGRPLSASSIHSQSLMAVKSSLTLALKSWFGVDVVEVTASNSSSADIVLTPEAYALSNTDSTGMGNAFLCIQGRPPFIVACDSIKPTYPVTLEGNSRITYLPQPFGPRKLAKTLTFCLECLGRPADLTSVKIVDLDTISPPFSSVSEERTEPSQGKHGHLTNGKLGLDKGTEADSSTHRRPRVLLVEDNEINLQLLIYQMIRLNRYYATASNGLQALQTYKHADGEFDLIFMDISMPIMDGMTATRAIRTFEQNESIAPAMIVALTGLASSKSQEEALESGADLFLTKPAPMKKLKAIVEDWIAPVPSGQILEGY